MATHIMIDLETMATSHDAAITQIGAVKFDPSIDYLDGIEFECHVKLESSVLAGLKMDPSTMMWWLMQPNEARKAFIEGQDAGLRLQRALHEFCLWVGPDKEIEDRMVWSHGATFDLPILASAFKAVDRKIPWDFRNARDTRTLFWLCEPYKPLFMNADGTPIVEQGVSHRAVDDARRQAKAVLRAINYLKAKAAKAEKGKP